MDAEGNKKTDNDLIYIGEPLEIDEDTFLKQLKDLYEASYDNDEERLLTLAEETVGTYKRNEE